LRRAQACYTRAGGTDAERERLPKLIKSWMLDLDRYGSLLDPAQTCDVEQLGELAATGTRARGLIVDIDVQHPSGLPKRAEWTVSTSVVSDTGRDHSVRLRHAPHLAQARDGIDHEMNDQLRERGVE
jgi:hypothetical protein